MEQNIPEKWKNLKLEFKDELKPNTKSILKNKNDVKKENHKIECEISFCNNNNKKRCVIL